MMSLLSILDEKEIRSTAQLAERMGTTTEMVEAQLERYAQLGHVNMTVMGGHSCGENCKKCKGCNGMKHEEQAGFWVMI